MAVESAELAGGEGHPGGDDRGASIQRRIDAEDPEGVRAKMKGCEEMKRPEIRDMEAAIRHYYGPGYIGNQEIEEIFGSRSHNTVSEMKKAVRRVEIERGIPEVVPRKVSVEVAYEVWNIDPERLIKNLQRLRKLGLA